MKNENWKCKECNSNEKGKYRELCVRCNRIRINEIVQKYRTKNKGIKNVWDKAERTIELKGICERCKEKPAEVRHHYDYSKPIEVNLLCAKCHKEIHSPNGHISNVTTLRNLKPGRVSSPPLPS